MGLNNDDSHLNFQHKNSTKTTKDGILQEVISIWMQLCSVAHFSVIKIRMGAISSAVSIDIHIEITSCKISSLDVWRLCNFEKKVCVRVWFKFSSDKIKNQSHEN